MICKDDWAAWLNTGRCSQEPSTQTHCDPRDSPRTLETMKSCITLYHSANLCIPTRTVPDKENWRHRGWQMAITDPRRGSLRQQVQQWDQETRTPWFCYWSNDNLSSIVIFQKKQLELPQNWQSWHDCVELSSSIPKPTKFEHWLTEAREHSPAVSQVGFSW